MPTWEHLEVSGASGTIGNTFLRQGGKRLAVVLPGFLGGWMTPAVYYCVLALLDKDCDVLCLDSIYRDHPDGARLRADSLAAVRAAEGAGDYGETTLAGKSLGTMAMAELLLENHVPADTPSIWLTPLLRSSRVLDGIARLEAAGLFVIGTADSQYDEEVLERLRCDGHQVLVLAGANHGLAVDGSAPESAEVPAQIVRAVVAYRPARLPDRS